MKHPDIVFTHPDLDGDEVQADLRHGLEAVTPGSRCGVCDEHLGGIHIVLKPRRGFEERWCLECFGSIAPACGRPGEHRHDFPLTG